MCGCQPANAYVGAYGGGGGGGNTTDPSFTTSVAAPIVITDVVKVQTATGNLVVQDSAGNTLATFTDLGTTGRLTMTGNIVSGGNISTAGGSVYTTVAGNDTYLDAPGGQGVHIRGDNGNKDLAIASTGATTIPGTMTAAGEAKADVGTATVAGFLGTTMSVITTAVGNVGAGEDTLISYTMPANSLVTTGRGIRVRAEGTAANNANAKTIKCKVGTQTVLTNAPTISVAGEQWVVEYTFIRTGASTQDWKAEYSGNTGAAGVFAYDPERGTATQTETGTLAVHCTGEAVDNDDLVMESQVVTAF